MKEKHDGNCNQLRNRKGGRRSVWGRAGAKKGSKDRGPIAGKNSYPVSQGKCRKSREKALMRKKDEHVQTIGVKQKGEKKGKKCIEAGVGEDSANCEKKVQMGVRAPAAD